MLPVCILLGFLLALLLSRYYFPKNKVRKILFSTFVPLSVGIIIAIIFALFKQTSIMPFGYAVGNFLAFTIPPAVVAVITLLVKLELSTNTINPALCSNQETISNESQIDILHNDYPSGDSPDTLLPDPSEPNDQEEFHGNPDTAVEDGNGSITQTPVIYESDKYYNHTEKVLLCQINNIDNQNDDVINCHVQELTSNTNNNTKHIVKITSNVECLVYLDCEKIGSVSDGKMIKISINDGPYLLRCESIFDEVVEHSFELEKDELFNFKFCITNECKPRKKWFSK